MTREEIIYECFKNVELIKQHDRLYGTSLLRKGCPLNRMIDEATGRLADDVAMFIQFIDKFVVPYIGSVDGHLGEQ